jgi:hypothetical protein
LFNLLLLDSNTGNCNRDIIIEHKTGEIRRISQYNGAYDPLHYVLPFLNGKKNEYKLFLFKKTFN